MCLLMLKEFHLPIPFVLLDHRNVVMLTDARKERDFVQRNPQLWFADSPVGKLSPNLALGQMTKITLLSDKRANSKQIAWFIKLGPLNIDTLSGNFVLQKGAIFILYIILFTSFPGRLLSS